MAQGSSTNTKRNSKREEVSELRPLEIGFKVESRFDGLKRNLFKKRALLQDQLKISGFFGDIWMWNLVFLNWLMAGIFFLMLAYSSSKLPEALGLNTNDDRYLDFIINKNLLLILPFSHIIFSFIIIYFGIKSQRKLNSLFASSFFLLVVFFIFEFLALRDYISYFL